MNTFSIKRLKEILRQKGCLATFDVPKNRNLTLQTWLSSFLMVLVIVGTLFGDSKPGRTYTTDGSQSDVSATIATASPGDTVLIPSGSFTWGKGGVTVPVNKAIILTGSGTGATTINIASDAPTWTRGVIQISEGATVRDFTITQPGSGNTTAFSAGSHNGWRITGIAYKSAPKAGYFCYAGSYGLIDNCTLNGGSGSDEIIFSRGPTDSWQTASSMGTVNAVYIEDCTFNAAGYVCDFNSNARGVVRFCTINGQMKIDGHGRASNTPDRGCRQMEVYQNRWTPTSGFAAAIELRGGTGMLFGNRAAAGWSAWFYLTEYGYLGQWPNFGSVYQTPANYPITDQIGVGMDPKTAGSEPCYVWNNLLGGKAWPRTLKSVAAGAIARYGQDFTEKDLIQANRDFFADSGFDGQGAGLDKGTKAQMRAFKPSFPGYGWWVTDEGSWNNGAAGSGQLYVWSGSAWVLKYTPYTYPHPMRTGR